MERKLDAHTHIHIRIFDSFRTHTHTYVNKSCLIHTRCIVWCVVEFGFVLIWYLHKLIITFCVLWGLCLVLFWIVCWCMCVCVYVQVNLNKESRNGATGARARAAAATSDGRHWGGRRCQCAAALRWGLAATPLFGVAERIEALRWGECVGFQIWLDRRRQGKCIDFVDAGATDDRATAQLLQCEHWEFGGKEKRQCEISSLLWNECIYYLCSFAKSVPCRSGATPFAPAHRTIRVYWSRIEEIFRS